MRLPSFLTKISPLGETLAAMSAGEAVLADAVKERNDRLCLDTADAEGLSLWEKEYGLPVPSGNSPETRKAAIRTAMAGGRTLTAAYLRELCVTLTGANRGEAEEEFADWTVRAVPVGTGFVPETDALERALERLKPAHLHMEVVPCEELLLGRTMALTGGILTEIQEN